MTFGDYRLATGTRQLFRGRAEVHLSPKAFDLLCLLIDHRDRVMSKTELHHALWPETFVTEANLASLVAEIRRALGDKSRTPRFIRTSHRFGYGFCGTIDDDVVTRTEGYSCWLIWRGQEVPLREGDNVIGRDSGATLALDFPSVSRRHARIVVTADGATIEDLESKNGTIVGQEKITGPTALADHDELQIGSARLTFRLMRHGDLTQTIDR